MKIFQLISKNSLRVSIFVFLVVAFFVPQISKAARLYITPATGVFPVGETVTVNVGIDTQGKEINALDLKLNFPADKIQLVSPNTSVSLIDVWASQPKYNNRSGEIVLQGGIPNGVITSGALITELTFRVRSTGQAFVTFSSESNVFLNDGQATPAGLDYQNALLSLVLPPPRGPLVTSGTHQAGEWSRSSDAIFEWLQTDVEGYSFILDKNPVTDPDDVVDGLDSGAFYQGVSEGVSFFHIKALRAGVWGGTSHYEIKVDSKPPAAFEVDMFPSSRTSVTQPTFSFKTSDAHSGISHYEINIIPLFRDGGDDGQTSFIEATSPYISHELAIGPYEAVIRAYDQAGNSIEETKRFRIVRGALTFTEGEGLVIADLIAIPWAGLLFALAILGGFIAREITLTRRMKALGGKGKETKGKKRNKKRSLPRGVETDLEELKKYRKKYGHIALYFLTFISLFGLTLPVSAQTPPSQAGERAVVSTPVITSWSQYITNNQIFYVKGSSDQRTQSIVLYVQNLYDGSLTSYEIPVEENGEWLYRHDQLLSPGEYAVWVQGVSGSIMSPPGAQYDLVVAREAISFGSSHVTLATLYIVIILVLATVLFVFWVIVRRRRFAVRRHYAAYLREAQEAEEAVHEGFKRLHEQLSRHLQDLKQKIESNAIDIKDVVIEEAEILVDMEKIEDRISKKVTDIEAVLQRHGDDSQDKSAH